MINAQTGSHSAPPPPGADTARHRPHRPTAGRRVAVTHRDRAIIDTVVRLGATTSTVLRQLHAPDTDPQTVRRRLRRLTRARLLTATGHVSPDAALHLYTVGPAALAPGQDRPWAPSLGQLEHTLAVGDTLLALTNPHLAPGMRMIGWHGEAELRGWAQPGHPRPDLRAHWQAGHTDPAGAQGCGWLDVEVDRGTEAGPAWRRKLARYLAHTPDAHVLAVTTTGDRAKNLAEIALGVGVHLLALDSTALAVGEDPVVYDTHGRRRHPLSHALTVPTVNSPSTTGGLR